MALISQIVVHSLNRIMYPDFAKRAKNGVRSLVPLAVRYRNRCCTTGAGDKHRVILIAPAIPWLIGESYRDVVFNLRVVCWLSIPLAIVTVPYDLLGALDRHGTRAKVYNTLCLAGAAATAAAVFRFGVNGAFVMAYLFQITLAASLWITLLVLARAEERGVVGAAKPQPLSPSLALVEIQTG